MSLGFDAISALPFATSGPDNSVTITASKNALTVSIGPVNIAADAVVEDAVGSPLTLGTGTLSITGTANITAPKTPLTLATGTAVVSGDANIRCIWKLIDYSNRICYYNRNRACKPTGSPLTLATGEPGIITWNEIIPGATMVWTPIDPY